MLPELSLAHQKENFLSMFFFGAVMSWP